MSSPDVYGVLGEDRTDFLGNRPDQIRTWRGAEAPALDQDLKSGEELMLDPRQVEGASNAPADIIAVQGLLAEAAVSVTPDAHEVAVVADTLLSAMTKLQEEGGLFPVQDPKFHDGLVEMLEAAHPEVPAETVEAIVETLEGF